MADWRDRMGPASFRGVPFFVETAERGGGRRTVKHEFPLRDEPFVEDMGRRARSFPVEGYVLGSDYLARRDALIDALEQHAGPGELVHPYYGTLRVICSTFRVRESSSDGGMARFAIDFEQTQSNPTVPEATPAVAAKVSASADAVVAALRAEVAARKAAALPKYSLASLSAVVSSAAVALGDALEPVVQETQDLATLRRDLDNLVLDLDALVRQPANVLGGFAAVLGLFDPAAVTSRLGIKALLAAYGFTPASSRPPATTATRLVERAAYDLLLRIVRTLTVVQAARLAPDAGYESYDDAVSVRDALGERLEEQAESAEDDVYAAIVQLRADLVRALPGEEGDLPRLVRYTPAATVPSLVLAHQIYGDLEREADLVARNGVVRPGFVVGGVELEVLSRG